MAILPYVTSPGNIDKALAGIKRAAVPERVSQDFVRTILKIPGGSGAQMTSFLKKIGFVNQDGSPGDLYKKFRNPSESGSAIATAIRHAYTPLYVRNEFMHELSDDKLIGLLVEETGQPHDANPTKMTLACIKHLKKFAKFGDTENVMPLVDLNGTEQRETEGTKPASRGSQTFGLNLGYTINLNLPATSDPEVFDAIFKSIRRHLLEADDA